MSRRSSTAAPLVVAIAAVVLVVGAAWASDRSDTAVAPQQVAASRQTSESDPSLGCGAPEDRRPTVVMVHGAWADTSSWDGEIAALRGLGVDARAIPNPLEDLVSDASSVAAFLDTVDGEIVLVGHSYGGSVITNAAAGVPSVKALVYVDAAAPDIGETTHQLSGKDSVLGAEPDSLYDTVHDSSAGAGAEMLYLQQKVFVDSFASSVPRERATRLWATQRAASTAAFATPSTAAAWATIPSWYLISSGDTIITPDSQRMMARRAGSTVTEFDGGSHLTLVSDPEAVVEVIRDAICSVR